MFSSLNLSFFFILIIISFNISFAFQSTEFHFMLNFIYIFGKHLNSFTLNIFYFFYLYFLYPTRKNNPSVLFKFEIKNGLEYRKTAKYFYNTEQQYMHTTETRFSPLYTIYIWSSIWNTKGRV